jgi:hypothetical protein
MRLYLLPLLLLLFLSCGPGSDTAPEEIAETIEGRWELVDARRDNVKTNLLEGLYFVFAADQSFETNLLTGEPQIGTYLLDGNEITTAGVAVPMTYEVIELENGILSLRSRYEGYLFDFVLRRVQGGQYEGGAAGADHQDRPET